jgi:hypothetical protein
MRSSVSRLLIRSMTAYRLYAARVGYSQYLDEILSGVVDHLGRT